MTSAIEKLKSRLLPYREKSVGPVVGHPFTYLQRVISQLERKVDARAVQMVPPNRRRALARDMLKASTDLTAADFEAVLTRANTN